MKNMTQLREESKKKYNGLTCMNNYKRTWSIIFLFTFCLNCGANCYDLKLQENFEPKRFFTGTWYETHRLNKTLTNWGKCVKIESFMAPDKIHLTTSAYIPFLFSRRTFMSSIKLDGLNKPHFLMNISVSSWNVSVIATDYDSFALMSSRYIKSTHARSPQCTEVIFIFKRDKNDKGHVKEVIHTADKIGICYDDFSMQNC